MPIYKLNGDVYDIPQEKQGEFESQFPDAFISYTAGADQYDIPISKRDDFLKDFPDAQLYSVSQPQVQETPIEDPYATTEVPMFDDEPNASLGESDAERGFGAGAREGWKGLKAGFQNLWGETANVFTGSSQDSINALNELNDMVRQGKDVAAETENAWTDAGREIRTGAMELLPGWMIKGWKDRVLARAEKEKVLDDIREALGEAGGDVDKARAILEQRAQEMSYGDEQIAKAAEKFADVKPTEGFGAWVGSNAVQMIPSASALIVGAVTKSPAAAKAIGMIGMGGMTAATAGTSMYEARQAGASDQKVWKVGITDGMIEYLTEKLPFDRYTSRIMGKVKGEVAQDLFSALRTNKATRTELENLLIKANERLGGKLFSKKNLKDYVADMLAEGASEFSAEALQTMTSMMYENPEDYPTINEILTNGWEGAKAGFFMGAVLGGASKTMEHTQNRKRRMDKGSVDVALVDFGDGEKDVAEVVEYDASSNTAVVLHDGSFEKVSGDAIADGYRFSYEEFENARLRQMEDEAVVSGNVTEGQIQGLEDNIARDIDEIKALAPEMTESEISAVLQSEIAVEPGTPLGEAVAKYQEDVARHGELVAAKREADAAKKEAIRTEIETAVGQRFWVQESGEDDGSGIIPVSETVEEVVYADGRVGYVVGSDESGNLTMVYTDGTKGFSSRAEIAEKENSGEILSNTVMGLDDYLAVKMDIDEVTREKARMQEEHALSVEEMVATHPQGSVINVGTEEAKVEVPIIAPPTKDGVIVQMPDGTTPMLTWEDVAHAEKKEITPKTNAQLNQSIVDEYRVAYTPAVPASSQPTQQKEEQVKRTSPANPLPLKADGSVDQTALWNKDPEGWAKWNDEKRQDGGADSLAYVTNAIAVEQAKMAELQTVRSQETDFDRRDALDAEIATAQERINRLVAIQQGYLAQPAVADAVQNVQTEPQTEEEKAKAEDQRREPFRKRAKEFGEKLGVKVNIAESLADVKEEQAREEILGAEVSGSGARFPGWYNRDTGEVTIYLPHVRGVADIDRTIIHEVVAHKGLRGLLGKEGYNVLCDAVWDMMTEAERAKYMAYPGVNGDKRLAADEYIARFAEGLDLEQSRPIWNKIAEAVQKILNSMGIRLEVTKEDLADLIAASYMRLQEQARAAQAENAPVVEEVAEEVVPETTIEQQAETGADVEADIEEVTEESTSPIIAAAQQDKGGISFNVTTEEPLQDKIRKFAQTEEGKATGWTEDDIESIIAETESLIDAIHRSSTGNEFYDEFAYKEPTIRVDWRDGEAKPIVTWTRANIEYKYDMSADLLCINNEGLEAVLSSDKMVALMEMFVPEKKAKKGEPEIKFTSEDYLELYNTLKDLGFVVPCKGCFDAAGRFKMLPSVAQKFAAEVNALIDERNKDPKAFDEKLKAKPGEKTVGGLPATAATKSAAIAAGVAGDNLTEHVKWTQLMSADGQTKMLSDWGGIFRAWQRTGAGRPKDKLLPEPYYGDIVSSVSTIIGKYGEKTPSFRDTLVNQGTGLRRNSHSEFRPVLAIDEIQFMRDAFIRNLTVFKYMKELDDVRLFGKMGVKFNMSFFPEYVPGTKVAGLDKDGNYIASEESVGSREFPYQGEDGKRHYDGMKGWEEAQKHINKDVSLSSVIFSIPHLLKALTDVPTPSDMRGIWGSLIPFHSSGATTASLAMQGLGMARANGVGHGFNEAFYDYGKGVTNFEAVQNDRFGEGWHIVSGTKAGTDVEPGHKLEFVNGNHYYNKALGVHLFASGYILDSELPAGVLGENGELDITNDQKKDLMHKFTIDYNDKVRELKGPYAYKDAADFYIAELPKLGLIPRFDFEVSEEKFLEMCEAANVDPRHPKLGWKGEGNSWSPIDSEAYYSLFCDYGMTDPATGEWAPHMPVGYVNEKGERDFRLPDNAVEIVKEGLDRFSEVRRSENARIDEAIEAFAERSVEKGRISQESVDKVLGKEPAPKKSGVIDLVEEARKAQAKHDAKAKKGKKSNVSFRITAEQDKAYMDAVESGDMDTAQGMVDEAAAAAGYTIRGDHGRVSKFTIFDKEKANPEGNWGQGFYFTNNKDDVENNYASVEGPDLEAKIEREVERRVNLAEMNEEFNEDGEVDEFAIREAVEKEFITSEPNVVHAAIKMDNPFVVGHGMVEVGEDGLAHYDMEETILGVEYETDEDGEADYDSASGTLVDLVEALNEELSNYEGVRINAYDILSNNIDGMTASQFETEARELLENSQDYLLNDDLAIMTSEILRAAIERAGFDGIIDNTVNRKFGEARQLGQPMSGVDANTRHYVVFKPNQIKDTDPVTYDDAGNVIPLSERFNPKKDSISFRMANENQAIFVSNAAKAVEGIKQEKATPEQWLKMIEKNGGLKAGEDKWMGLSDWLKASDKKTLTKQEVLDFINENMIVIEEQHYSNQVAYDNNSRLMDEKYPGWRDAFSFEWDDYRDAPNADILDEEEAATLYNKYNEDKVEIDEDGEIVSEQDRNKVVLWGEDIAKVFFGQEGDAVRPIHDTREVYTTKGLINRHEIALTVPTIESWGKSDVIHFGDAGEGRAVAWIRFGETWEQRPSPKISRKVLVIDEIQSKRHQEGREKGYMTKEERAKFDAHLDVLKETQDALLAHIEKLVEKYPNTDYHIEDVFKNIGAFSAEDKAELRRLKDAYDAEYAKGTDMVDRQSKLIPDAPFDKNWSELAMKRMLRYAAENGYDVIAWTKGEQQAERYGIGNAVSRIESGNAEGFSGTKKIVDIYAPNGVLSSTLYVNEDGKVVSGDYLGQSLSDIVGKEMAVKLMADGEVVIDGDNLRIGGEGMKGFYDRMLPAFMNKYGKKWGVKVEDIDLPNLENGLTMHSVPVTEEMKQSVMEGQVMFRMRTEEEDAMEFQESVLEEFKQEYRLPAPTTVVDVYDRDAVANALGYAPEKFTDAQYDFIMKGYQKGGVSIFDPETKKIAIFAKDTLNESWKMYDSIFHENTHFLVAEHPDLLELGEWLWQNSEPLMRKTIKEHILANDTYKGYETDEMLSGYTGVIMATGKADVAYAKTPEELRKHWDLIFNAFGYGRKTEDNPRRRGTGNNTGRVESSGNRADASAEQKHNDAAKQELTAEERRVIGEYFPEFNKSEDVRMKVNSQGKDLTEGQKEFFANSKAVDKDGNLLVLYHGTPRAGFTEFKSGWFTTSKEDAISYSGDRKGRLFDPDEKYEPETLTAGDFRLGYMTFDSEEDRTAFLERFPYADEVMSEKEYEDARMGAEDEEYDALTARRKEFAEVWNAYREYERERFVDTTIGDLIANPETYTEEDLMRAMLEYDSNATFDNLDDMSAEERKDALVSALQTANEETEGGILDMVVPTRVPRNGEGLKHNDLGNRTYEVYANVEKPYEIDANGRGSEFESGDVYKAIEEALNNPEYDGVIIRNWRVGRHQQLGDVVVPKNGSQIKLTSNENPTKSHNVSFRTSLELDEEFGDALFKEESTADENGVSFRVVTDSTRIEELEDGPKVEAYRAVQIDKNGKIYSPMASRLKSTKKGTKQATNEAAQMNQWDEAVESLDKVDENGRITILDEDGGTTKVSYNPYGHCCVNSMMNDQFKRAWERDGLYVMKVLAPESELTAGYHAEKAKDAVGIHKWKTGAVGNKLPENKRREILLTRWMKNVKVMPWEEVAQDWIKTLEGENIDVPFNVVPRKILNMLAEAGVKIVAPEKGMENATKAYEQWLADPKGYVGNTELPDHVKALNEETDDEGPDNEPRFRTTGTPTDEVVANGLTLTPAQTAEVAANIFAALPEESRKKITKGLNGNILGLQDAILQIPTSLATKENWNEEDRAMADVVAEEMTKMAGEMTRPFSAPEALWLLYNNLNKGTDLISQASRALVQRNLGFDEETLERQEEAKRGVSFRMVGDATANAKASIYNRGAVNVWTRLKESFVDMQASVEELVSAIEKATGKVAKGFENILLALNQQSSKGLAAMESYEQRFLMPMFDEIRKIMDKAYAGYDTVVRYVILKHGLERNKKLAQRDAKAHYQEIYDEMIAKVNSMDDSQKRTYLTNAQLQDADAKAKLATLKAADTSAFTEEEKNAHKRELAKAKEEVKKAKENLERAQKINSMSEQELKDELDKIFEKIENGTDSVYKELRKNDYSGISSMFYDQLGVNRKDYSTEEEYQAALMLAKNDRFSSLEEVEAQAEGEVSSFEGRVDTKELWKRINAATKETLRQQYEANMISKDQYENLRNMFEYYVPLRGFKDNTAEDMYTYYRKPNSTGYTKPILGAEGRKTEAESPFGWIAAMAGSAIASNVKNEAKLALYYFVSNRPNNGIATLSRTWFVHTPGDVDANGKKIFKPAYPPFSEDLSSDAAKQAYEDWQEQMRELQKQGLAYEAGQRLNLGNAVVNISDANKPEHVVTVKVAGKDYTIVINGNPRAAQAINGELNLESTADDYSAIFGPVLRWMSSVNTSYNPEFWITNLMRDMAFTWMAVNTKEDPAYRKKFSKNYWKCFRVIGLVAKNEKGTIGNSYIEDMYKDFVKYGGVTGYTQIKDSETWEKEIDNYLSSTSPESLKNGKMMRGMKTFFHAAHRFGESLEQVSRFAAFLTSREMGKTINEAIADAKEITVNFNRKGSGKMITLEESKYLTDKNGQPLSLPARWAAVGLSSIAPLGRRTIMFFNAAVQGLNSVYRLWKKNPKRLAGWTAAYFTIGVLNAVIHALLDDDDDYLDIPQYERRNSLMLGGNGAYLKWALPQEARAFYALGDLAVETILGRNPHQNVVGEAMKIATEVLPVNPTEGWKAFVPSIAIPAVELMLNEDYKGAPIYNEQKWLSKEERERTAKWSSAYQGTGTMYKGIAQGLNYITGGDKHDAGKVNLQPEKMEHIVQSAFGGTIRTADKFINTIWAMFDPEEDVTVRQTPFLNRILTINDERFKNVHVNEVFDYYKADADHALTLEKKYQKDRDQESLNELRRSDEYLWAKVYRKYKKALDNLKEKLKVAEGTAERKELMRQQDELKRRVIKEISEL